MNLFEGLPRRTTRFWMKLGLAFGRIVTFVQVGRIRVTGQENLPATPVVICCNHSHYADIVILPLALRRWLTFMAHPDFYKTFGFLKRILETLGAFPAGDGTPRGSLRACACAIRALASGYTVTIFPEGRTTFDWRLKEVRRGAIRILRGAMPNDQEPALLVPVYIRYGRYPGAWIRHFSDPLQYLLVLLGFWRYRRGARVIIGPPVSQSDLPESEKAAAEVVAERIRSLDPERGDGCHRREKI